MDIFVHILSSRCMVLVYKKVLVKLVLLLEILLILWGVSKCETKNDVQVSTTTSAPEADLSESSDDLVYHNSLNSITIKGNASISVNVPESPFRGIKDVKVVIYDNLRGEEITSSEINLDVSTVYTYQIVEEGTYSIYAITGEDHQIDTLDLTEYVTVSNVSSGEDGEAIQIK